MKIMMLRPATATTVVAYALDYAIENRYSVVMNGIECVVTVPEWECWLKLMWRGFAKASALSNPAAMRQRYLFRVLDYNVPFFVMYDEEMNGLRYGRV